MTAKNFLYYVDGAFNKARLFVLSLVQEKLARAKSSLHGKGEGVESNISIVEGEGNTASLRGINSSNFLKYIYYFSLLVVSYVFAFKISFYAVILVMTYGGLVFVRRRIFSSGEFYR